jgi:hypothetical protein
LADIAERITKEEKALSLASSSAFAASPTADKVLKDFATSMTSVVAKFNQTSYNQMKYEDFLDQLSRH